MQKRLYTILFATTICILLLGCQSAQPMLDEAPKTLPFDWPMPLLTQKQIRAVRRCDVEKLSIQRYPLALTEGELWESYAPQNDCDWATLAIAYAARRGDDEPISSAALEAFTNAALGNPGFMLTTMFFYEYFDATAIVETPDFAQQEIVNVKIEYTWDGLGYTWDGLESGPIEYSIEIRQTITEPIVISPQITTTLLIDKSDVQALAAAMDNFLPVKSDFDLYPCTDNYPQWSVALMFADGTEVKLYTGSNFLSFGGPWFMQTADQIYVQNSLAFADAVIELVYSLGLMIGYPAGMYCHELESVFDLAYPWMNFTW